MGVAGVAMVVAGGLVSISIASTATVSLLRAAFMVRTASGYLMYSRPYCKKVDFKKLRPMILKRIEDRAKHYPIRRMIPVAEDVLKSRAAVIHGVSVLLKVFSVMTCKFCPEVYIGKEGHLIKTCRGYRRQTKNQVHCWVPGSLNDILVPVEAFHLQNMSQGEIRHHQRFDFDRIPAVLELCWQAGVDPSNAHLYQRVQQDDSGNGEPLPSQGLLSVSTRTLRAWESLRTSVQKLLLVYPAKVCQHCSEVHIGPSGHKARLCGIFKFESWRGTHFWKKAEVDDLIPPKMVWHRRPQDPPVLIDDRRDYYGHAPAVVDLCIKGGASAPSSYHCAMKLEGYPGPRLACRKLSVN
uniref:APO domain-containing protein n=1 Tax=Kalanchoe fedtschenkoi TaxID=63787 RepID=A0A7N0VCB2_KALFE